MARSFTTDQKTLLRSPSIKVRLLITFYLDEGTYRFCDDVVDVSDGTNTYIGASALLGDLEYKSGSGLAAEPVTLKIDGNRMTQYGVADPARALSDIMGYLHTQRRVDWSLGFAYADQQVMNIVVPIAAMKINNVRLIDEAIQAADSNSDKVEAKLEIVLDSLASRYNRATFRTRAHEDQLEIDPTDNFFSYVTAAATGEKTLYWGKDSPLAPTPAPRGLFGMRG